MAIIEHRDNVGTFSSIDELTQVKGIGEKKLEKVAEQITVSE
jgi:competence protein ComEA